MNKDKAEKLPTVGESYFLSFVITSHHQQKEGEPLRVLKTCGLVEEEEEEDARGSNRNFCFVHR